MSKLEDIIERVVAETADMFGGSLSDLEAGDNETQIRARDSVKLLVIELIKSNSEVFNASDHQTELTEFANELIAKVEEL